MRRFLFKSFKLFIIIFFFKITPCFAYSVLTHEALIDANWDRVLLPLLKQKFPRATAEDLKNAHGYVYGGAVSPDMGYYPFGSKLYTNLVHYVRTGDYVENLFKEAKDLNEYAFALGVLCHYYADEFGHGLGVNKTVPLIYPEIKNKFGNTVTYADDRLSHLRTEFSFDVLQTGRGNYASENYHDFIGFQVSKDVMQKAFMDTYNLDINDLFGNFDRALGTFRWAVKSLIPTVTRIAWKIKGKDIRKTNPKATRRSFIYRLRNRQYYKEYGKQRQKNSFGEAILAFVIRVAPKVGPLKILKFRNPTPEAEKIFAESFDSTILNYSNGVAKFSDGKGEIPNIDWDTGKKTMQHEYRLADRSYSDWVIKLKEKNFETVTPAVKENILAFYKNYSTNGAVDAEQWQKTTVALQELKMKK